MMLTLDQQKTILSGWLMRLDSKDGWYGFTLSNQKILYNISPEGTCAILQQ